MNYSRIYTDFISDRRLKQPPDGQYSERHHILPRSLGGGNGADNLIRLTAGDHLFAHVLLAKIHGGRLIFAAMILMRATVGRGRVARQKYAWLKRANSAFRRGRKPWHGKPHTPQSRARLSVSLKLANQDPELRIRRAASLKLAWQEGRRSKKGRPFTTEQRAKLASSLKAHYACHPKVVSAETRAKISGTLKGRRGKSPNAETRAKLSEASTRAHREGRGPGIHYPAARRAKLSASLKAHYATHEISAETRARISTSARARCAREAAEKASAR